MAIKTMATCDVCGKEVPVRGMQKAWIKLHIPAALLAREPVQYETEPILFMACSRGCAHDALDGNAGR
jgi:hypothetical protein